MVVRISVELKLNKIYILRPKIYAPITITFSIKFYFTTIETTMQKHFENKILFTIQLQYKNIVMKVENNKEELSEMPNIKNKNNLLHPFQCKYSQVEKLI
jgi:hypothetical protein